MLPRPVFDSRGGAGVKFFVHLVQLQKLFGALVLAQKLSGALVLAPLAPVKMN